MSVIIEAWKQFICRACGLIYDEELGDPDSGLAPGTRFEDIPEDWECPLCGVTKVDFEPFVQREAAPSCAPVGTTQEPSIVVVGAGLAGWAAVEAIRALDAQTPITLISSCVGNLYHKPELSVALSRGITADAMVRESAKDAAMRLGVKLYTETFVVGLATGSHQLRTTRGTVKYTKLILAQGAKPILPPEFPPHLCWRVNDLAGWSGLQIQLGRKPQRIAIVGAGMIGCEMAEDFAKAGHKVTLIDRQSLPLGGLLAEIVINTIPRDRGRETIHHDPQFYRIRNHLVDFLVRRSKEIQRSGSAQNNEPLIVRPGLEESTPPPEPSNDQERKIRIVS